MMSIEKEICDAIKAIKNIEHELEGFYEEFKEIVIDCPHLIGRFCRHKTFPNYVNIVCDLNSCPLPNIEKKKIDKKKEIKKKEDIKMSERKKFVKLRVISTKDYLIPVPMTYEDGNYTHINGWTIDEVIDDWFKKHLGSYHASRDAYTLGGSEQFIRAIKIGEKIFD